MKIKSLFITALLGTFFLGACKKKSIEPICEEDPTTNLSPIELTGNQSVGLVLEDRINSSVVPDYIVSGTYTIEAGVQVLPGTSIRMKAGAKIIVEGSGSFKAIGTASSRIRIYGESATPGYWDYIRFVSNNVDNVLSHVTIEDGGGDSAWDGIVYCYENGRLAVSNATIRNSARAGMVVYSDDFILSEFSSVNVEQCAMDAVTIRPNDMAVFDNSFIAQNNGFNRIRVEEGELLTTQTWKKTNVPFFIAGNVDIKSDVTIQPGGNFIFSANKRISVNSNGSLKAIGTASDMITFKGAQEVEGAWACIRFWNSTSLNNEFQYCEVAHGGSDSSWDAAIYLYDGSRFRLGNSIVRNSLRYGLINYQDANVFTDDGNNTFSGNIQGDIGN